MTIVVTGSVAYDQLMTFPGNFVDHILPDKLSLLNVSFSVDSLRTSPGGSGGAIAYTLGLLGERARLLATVGEDFADYRARLDGVGVDTSFATVIPASRTSMCFLVTDGSGNQIAAFFPGAMDAASTLSLDTACDGAQLVVVSPNDVRAMARVVADCKSLGIPYVYEPAQQLARLTAEDLLSAFSGAACVAGNEYEFGLIGDRVGMTPPQLLELTPLVVVTCAAAGSTIYTLDAEIEIDAVPPDHIVDPTGAGEAYLAGIVRGIVRGENPERYGRIAALAATYAVEALGTQGHQFTLAAFAGRFHDVFGEQLYDESSPELNE